MKFLSLRTDVQSGVESCVCVNEECNGGRVQEGAADTAGVDRCRLFEQTVCS